MSGWLARARAWLGERALGGADHVVARLGEREGRINKERELKWRSARDAIQAGDVGKLRGLLDSPGKMDSAKDGSGHGALMCEAARVGSIACAQALLSSGCRFESFDHTGRDALAWAVREGRPDFLAWALSRGAAARAGEGSEVCAKGALRGPVREALEVGDQESFWVLEPCVKWTPSSRVAILRWAAARRSAAPILRQMLRRAPWLEALGRHDQEGGGPTLLIRACRQADSAGPEIVEALAAVSDVVASREAVGVAGAGDWDAAQAAMACEELAESDLERILSILEGFDPERRLGAVRARSAGSFHLACSRRGGAAARWLLARGFDPADAPGGAGSAAERAVARGSPQALAALVGSLGPSELQSTLVAALSVRWSPQSRAATVVLLRAGACPLEGVGGGGSPLEGAAEGAGVEFLNMLLELVDWGPELEAALRRAAAKAVDAGEKGASIDRWAQRAARVAAPSPSSRDTMESAGTELP